MTELCWDFNAAGCAMRVHLAVFNDFDLMKRTNADVVQVQVSTCSRNTLHSSVDQWRFRHGLTSCDAGPRESQTVVPKQLSLSAAVVTTVPTVEHCSFTATPSNGSESRHKKGLRISECNNVYSDTCSRSRCATCTTVKCRETEMCALSLSEPRQ